VRWASKWIDIKRSSALYSSVLFSELRRTVHAVACFFFASDHDVKIYLVLKWLLAACRFCMVYRCFWDYCRLRVNMPSFVWFTVVFIWFVVVFIWFMFFFIWFVAVFAWICHQTNESFFKFKHEVKSWKSDVNVAKTGVVAEPLIDDFCETEITNVKGKQSKQKHQHPPVMFLFLAFSETNWPRMLL